jgi:AAA domain
VLFPLFAAAVAGVATAWVTANGADRWCGSSSFSCGIGTNVLAVVLVGGVTSYWFYGFRRAMLLARHRRAVLAEIGRAMPQGDDGPADHEAPRDTLAAVLSQYQGWRSQPPVTLLGGLPGSGKTVFLAEVVRTLVERRSWHVPVLLGDIAGGGEQDILDAAKRQLEIGLHEASINPGLVESLWRSLTRSRRLMVVIDDIDRVGPGLSSYERTSVVLRLISSAQRLGLPVLATGRSASLESVAGFVVELPAPSPTALRQRLEDARGVDPELSRQVLPALTGALATPSMVDRVISLLRREGGWLVASLADADAAADLVLWRRLLEASQAPGAAMTADALELVAYVLLTTGQREINVGASPEWQHAMQLSEQIGIALPAHRTGVDEIAGYSGAGFLDEDSTPVMLRFSSPEVQAILAGQFLVREPRSIAAVVPQLGTTAAARQAVDAALRYANAIGSAGVHDCLLAALDAPAPLTAAAHAAALTLAIRCYPPGARDIDMDRLAARLSLLLADRITAASGPALGASGLRDAVEALTLPGHPGRERHLLTALHSSSFQVRLSVAIALIRLGIWELIEKSAEQWIAKAESPSSTGVQHQLGLALWFCPHLASVSPSDRGADLYARGLRLASANDSNPLMFEVSLARGFKLSAWARPDLPADARAIELLRARPRFWYSRLSLVHAIGIRAASKPGRQAGSDPAVNGGAEPALRWSRADPHPLVREAVEVTRTALASGSPVASFCWLSESDMGRSRAQMSDQTMRLLGDVSLLLNLIYCAEPWSEREWRLLGTSSELPSCISRPAHRIRYMTSGCPADCPFLLCPYPSPSRRPRGRGELSAAFCRTQAEIAERLGPAPWHAGRSTASQVDFWLYAEQHLASREGWEIDL